jgi:hypothetical protein
MRRNSALILILLASSGWSQAQQPDRVENWKKDLNFFAASLRGSPIPGEKDLPGQKDFAKLYPHFDADMAALDADLPNLRNGAIAWRLARILASAHVGHNSIFPGDPQSLPLTFEWLGDGPVVTAANAEFKTAIGTRVLKVGSLSTEAYLEAVSPYIAFETDGWRRTVAGYVMRQRALLELLNLAEDGKVHLTLEGSNGPSVIEAPFIVTQTRLISFPEALGLPVYLANSHPADRYYWRQFLPESKTLYVQYRQCADDPKLKFADFAAQTLAEIDASKPQRVIVDLRFNGGGNSRVLSPLTAALASRFKAIGAPIVLIGSNTFSSGVMAARELRDKAKARLVGTPTGGLLGGYGEARSRKLPYSQLGMQWTVTHFAKPEPVRPDITVIMNTADLRAGRDPVLDAAIAAPRN